MNELQAMQDRLAQLEQETLQLKAETQALKSKSKAQALRQRFVFGLAVVGLGLAGFTHNGNTKGANATNAQMEAGLLVCKELRVIDNDRRTVLSLSRTKDDEGMISVYNGTTRVVGISASTEAGSGVMWINDERGNKMAQLHTQDGKGYLWTQK